ncbi:MULTISPECIES: hypothetical protein [Pseudomonas]|uniref:DUF7716 domain-containing protein n=1 Tax=Pseudomonas TaxID=286 RepID=UPI000CD06461|nr:MULTISPECIES: hypothetical protein [unclassified Pseudomonas]POA30183.1 hypothetical protein C1887_17325 [Pseudomonas sp. GW456-R21]POA66664.1 hypothetical protein C1884_14125 [Pseudomonas sp. GW460-R15]
MHYQQHLSIGELIGLLRQQEKTLHFCVYGTQDSSTITLQTVCVIEAFPQITDNDEEIYPDFVIRQGLEFWFSDDLLEDVVMSALQHKPSVTDVELLKAIRYYAEHDCFMSFYCPPPATP